MKNLLELADHARVWIYQANRFLSDDEETLVNLSVAEFIENWSSHGQKMDASAAVMHHRFVVIGADEAMATASGCGIDKSVHFMKELGSKLNLDFFQRTQVVFLQNDNLQEVPLHQFWAMRKAGLVADETVLFDNTVKTLADLKHSWQVPFSKSWHAEMWQR